MRGYREKGALALTRVSSSSKCAKTVGKMQNDVSVSGCPTRRSGLIIATKLTLLPFVGGLKSQLEDGVKMTSRAARMRAMTHPRVSVLMTAWFVE